MKNVSLRIRAALPGLLTLPTPLYSANANPNPEKTPATLANHIAELLLSFVVPIAVIGVFWTAYSLLVSQGDPDAYAKAKKNATNLVIGAVIIIFAVVIFNFVYSLFRTAKF